MSRRWLLAFGINLALAAGIQLIAPAQPRLSDRQEYEYVGEHGLAANCPMSVYCYRVLVPSILAQVPLPPEVRWRGYQLTANTLAGTIIATTASGLPGGWATTATAGILTQTSFGFAFTAYDPYTADPLVFVILAAIAFWWFANRPGASLAAGVAGVFAKETVVLMSAATALAAIRRRDRPRWQAWVAQAIVVGVVLLAFHWVMDTYFGWSMTRNPAAQFSKGSWLALWWSNNPGLLRKGFFLFAPFGFAWLYAAAGFRTAPARLRELTLGTVLPFLALNYVQNPERALSNTFFVVVPLATLALSRVPVGVGLAAACANGLLTAKVGTSTTLLPPAALLLGPAAVSAAIVGWYLWRSEERPPATAPASPAVPRQAR